MKGRSKSAVRVHKPLPDIPPLHQTESKRILTIFNHALLSTSLREKNELLQEVEVLWTQQNEKFEQIQTSNSTKRNELQMMKNQQQTRVNEREQMRENTSFFEHIRKRKPSHTHEELIKLIEEKQQEIQSLGNLNFPGLLDEILEKKCDNETRYFKLSDINFRRAEELAYCYQKRLQAVERSQESNEIVMREFGSVTAMIEMSEKLTLENEQLKREESDLMKDMFVKRVRVRDTPGSIPRDLTMIMRNMLDVETEILSEYESHPDISSPDAVDIDKFCNDPNSSIEPNEVDSSEFGNSMELDDIKKFSDAQNDRERLNIYQEIIKVSEVLVSKLQADLPPLDPPPVHQDHSSTRIEKMTEDNKRLLYRIHAAQQKLENLLTANEQLTKKLSNVMKTKRYISCQYANLLRDYRELTSSHIVLKERHSLNTEILRALMGIDMSMGSALLHKGDSYTDEKNYIVDQVESAIQQYIEQHPKPVIEDPPSPPKEQEVIQDPRALLRNRRKSHRLRINRTRNVFKSELFREKTHEIVLPQPVNCFDTRKYSTIELLNMMALSMKLGGFAFNVSNDYYSLIHGFITTVMKDIRSYNAQKLKETGRDMSARFSKVNFFSNKILVKDKCNIEIQTDVVQKVDVEGQTPLPNLVSARSTTRGKSRK